MIRNLTTKELNKGQVPRDVIHLKRERQIE
jgi:hypothetical protein